MFLKGEKTAGFTLIEMLVVVAITLLLAAMILPVFTRARDKARQTACRNNVRQIGIGLIMYTQENAGKWPFHKGSIPEYCPRNGSCTENDLWPSGGPTSPQLFDATVSKGVVEKKVFNCPGNPVDANLNSHRKCVSPYVKGEGELIAYGGKGSDGETYQEGGGPNTVSYIMDTYIPKLPQLDPRRAVLADGLSKHVKKEAVNDYDFAMFSYIDSWKKNHHSGVNVLFADGHVKYVAGSEQETPDGTEFEAIANPYIEEDWNIYGIVTTKDHKTYKNTWWEKDAAIHFSYLTGAGDHPVLDPREDQPYFSHAQWAVSSSQ